MACLYRPPSLTLYGAHTQSPRPTFCPPTRAHGLPISELHSLDTDELFPWHHSMLCTTMAFSPVDARPLFIVLHSHRFPDEICAAFFVFVGVARPYLSNALAFKCAPVRYIELMDGDFVGHGKANVLLVASATNRFRFVRNQRNPCGTYSKFRNKLWFIHRGIINSWCLRALIRTVLAMARGIFS